LRASQLEAQLAQAELQVLKMQLQPHFLFNTLNTIAVLIRKDPDAATEMVGRLSALLRFVLEHSGVQEVSLRTELELLDRYLQIEQTRFGERLSVRLAIDPEALDGRVPNMILQPLVENAIKHGISKRRGAGYIEVTAARINGSLRLEIRDDGENFNGDSTVQEGVGLGNTRARLQQLYGDRYSFRLSRNGDHGTVASLEVPFVRHDETAL
jgi:LytS/YehU family sensor histidine kinase